MKNIEYLEINGKIYVLLNEYTQLQSMKQPIHQELRCLRKNKNISLFTELITEGSLQCEYIEGDDRMVLTVRISL